MRDYDLHHHGDREVGPGLVDLAVNVRLPRPPSWLRQELASALDSLAAYPSSAEATRAVAARHGRAPSEVLVTAGAAEAFTLLASAFRPRRAVVVHPQFTEPEAALRAAGHEVSRVILSEEDGFVLDPALVPADADLVFVGNPTNPTSVLHPAASLVSLARPGRVLVVDEAFLDAVPGESESLASGVPGRGGAAQPDEDVGTGRAARGIRARRAGGDRSAARGPGAVVGVHVGRSRDGGVLPPVRGGGSRKAGDRGGGGPRIPGVRLDVGRVSTCWATRAARLCWCGSRVALRCAPGCGRRVMRSAGVTRSRVSGRTTCGWPSGTAR